MPRQRFHGEAGQATVEFVALVPLLVGVALVVLTLLAGHAAKESADQAAVAAAVATLQGTDAGRAADEAAPDWADVELRLRPGAVTARVRPHVPRFVAKAIDAERTVIFDPSKHR